MALVDPLLSSPPAGQTFISFSQQVARARTTCMKDFVTVRLRQESGAAMTLFWGEKESTIVDVLNEFTPTALENASPVIVIHGVLAAPDALLGSFPLDSDDFLPMTILARSTASEPEPETEPEPTVLQQRLLPATSCSIGECPEVERHPSCNTGEFPEVGDDRIPWPPPNLMTVHLRHPEDGRVLVVLMPRSTTIEQVLKDYTPSCLKNENPDVVIDGRRPMPDMTLGCFPHKGDPLELTFAPALDR